VLHSNKAAVLLSLQPPAYVDALEECNNALLIQPKHIRALLRRARAFEALGKFKEAQADLELLLTVSWS
jgi:tetratricopeptide (TPR) repeat protein